MRLGTVFGSLAALAVAVEGNRFVTVKHVVHEERGRVRGSSWTQSRRLSGSQTLPVRIGLTQQNLDRADEFLDAVSHPKSAAYGKHWSPEKIIDTFSAKQETIDAVRAWLEGGGIEPSRIRLSAARNWVEFQATVSEAEALMQTQYHEYHHTQSGQVHVACERYHVPQHLAAHIDLITPTVHFDQPVLGEQEGRRREAASEMMHVKKRFVDSRMRPQKGLGLGLPANKDGPRRFGGEVVDDNILSQVEHCDQAITPDCIRALYQVPLGTLAASNNTLGIVEYTPQGYLQKDLDKFFHKFQRELVGKSPISQLIENAALPGDDAAADLLQESSLDLEYAMSLVAPQQVTLFQVGDATRGASFGNFLDAIDGSYCSVDGGDSEDPSVDSAYPESIRCGVQNPTNVISTSYGYNEGDLGEKYQQRQCAEYMKLGLRGVSFLFSSGDNGVGGNGGRCFDPATGAYNDGKSGIFNPSFPSTCPYVTSVGATQILNGSSVRGPESACEQVIQSGGGFSNVFATPKYQKATVAAYFKEHQPPYGPQQYNNTMKSRGYPDISANGAKYVVAVKGKFYFLYGTSASSPVVASLINMINEKRLEAGKSVVGFINPVLYQHPEVLNDITNGHNPGCGTDGFAALPGWDPVTGLGTPNYPKMLDLWMALP